MREGERGRERGRERERRIMREALQESKVGKLKMSKLKLKMRIISQGLRER